MAPDKNGWSEYEKLVMDKLESHTEWLKGLNKEVTSIRIEVAKLKVKAGIWGGLAGIVSAVASMILFYVKANK